MTDPDIRVDLDHMQAVYDATKADARTTPVLSQRAVAHIDKELHMVGQVGRVRLESDEPPSRGGLDQAPTPLQYLLAGAGF
ncbi:MAG TPA: hypothetical protein VMW47_01865 [Verrucomicrobiae bacterium]|nr:hypothetical protein [Verrucomicrobiae bacterium]